MPCACDQCLQHYKTLGLLKRPASKAAIHKAYRESAKLWHPDHFENDPRLRPAAEEHFKLLQVAYRELSKHNTIAEESQSQSTFATQMAVPPISFGRAPGCFVAPHFPDPAREIIAGHLGPGYTALAIVDLTDARSQRAAFSQFLLLADHAIIARDTLNIASILWYTGLGEIKLIDERKGGKLGFLKKIAERISGIEQKYSLQIYRLNGTHFYTLAGQVDDSVKKVIYNFLLRKKSQAES